VELTLVVGIVDVHRSRPKEEDPRRRHTCLRIEVAPMILAGHRRRWCQRSLWRNWCRCAKHGRSTGCRHRHRHRHHWRRVQRWRLWCQGCGWRELRRWWRAKRRLLGNRTCPLHGRLRSHGSDHSTGSLKPLPELKVFCAELALSRLGRVGAGDNVLLELAYQLLRNLALEVTAPLALCRMHENMRLHAPIIRVKHIY
jgi:hypothetical protein